MTPEQETGLLADVRTTRETVVRMQARCEPCLETVAAHETILEGPASNGNRPGLRTRVCLVEESCEAIKASQAKQVKWLRAQLGAIIAAGIAVATAVATK